MRLHSRPHAASRVDHKIFARCASCIWVAFAFFDLSGYRRAVRNLRAHRALSSEAKMRRRSRLDGAEAFHLYNEFGHLVWIDELLREQLDLFEC